MNNVFTSALSFIAGIAIGLVAGHVYNASVLSRLTLASSFARMIDDLNTLAVVRNGDCNELLDEKERALSAELLAISALAKVESLSSKEVRYLKMVIRHREKVPFRTGEPLIDNDVEQFLSAVKETYLTPPNNHTKAQPSP